LEVLESRVLMAVDCLDADKWQVMTPPSEPFVTAASVSSLLANIRTSDAGSRPATAADIGTLSNSRQLNGSVGGFDNSDFIRFTIAETSRVQIQLSGLRADLDIAIYSASGERLARSELAGSASESIDLRLSSGTYFVEVVPYRWAFSTYRLTLNATPTPSSNAPPPPSTSTDPIAAFPDVPYFGGSNDWNVNSVRAPEAWSQGYAGQGVTVAVIDTGVDWSHSDLNSQIWVNPDEIANNGIDDDGNGWVDDVRGWDFVSNDNNPMDSNGHGTHVAGTIAAKKNDSGATGIAFNAKIMPVRVLDSNGSGTDLAVANGIRYAVQEGARIINLSLGGSFSTVIQSAMEYARQLNVFVVVASGNESASTPSYPARFSSSMTNVLSVGAYDQNGQRARFSNGVGGSRSVQVDAPGSNIFSTLPGNRYANFSGTSMAAPHVAGVAALALSANPNLTPQQLRNQVVRGSSQAIAGSDSQGGINAAITVAMAKASAASPSATPGTSSLSVSTLPTTNRLQVVRYGIASVVVAAPVVQQASKDSEDLVQYPARPETFPSMFLSHPTAVDSVMSQVIDSWNDLLEPSMPDEPFEPRLESQHSPKGFSVFPRSR
jgi:subtilisin family serine protease